MIEPPVLGPDVKTVALCLSEPSEQSVIKRWLESSDRSVTTTTLWAGVDMVIADPKGLVRHELALTQLRRSVAPCILPVLLVLPAGVSLAEVEPLHAMFDDFIAAPVDPRALRIRVRSAIRTRTLSLELKQKVLFEQRIAGVVGHDMRSPLSVLTMMAEMLSADDAVMPSHLRGAGPRTARATRTLQHLAEDLMVVAQGRAGVEISVVPEVIELGEVVRGALELIPHSGRVNIVEHGSLRLVADPRRIGQLVINLVQNAMRHGDPSEPIVVTLDGRAVDEVVLCVTNRGSIAPEVRASLFESFRTSGARRHRGVGLGLYIVTVIAAAHDTKPTVNSQDGRVTVRLGLSRAFAEPPDLGTSSKAGGIP